MTAVFESICAAVRDQSPELEHRSWQRAEGNSFASIAEGLFDTPHGYWNAPSDVLPANHSQRFVDAFSSSVDNTKHTIDIVTLGEITGVFRERLFRGIKESIYKTGNPISVRVLFGLDALVNLQGKLPDTQGFLRDLKNAVGFTDTLSAWAGAALIFDLSPLINPFRSDAVQGGWNHAKIVAVDSQHLLVGGHNWGGDHNGPYLNENPVFDLTVRLRGPVAHAGMMFSNFLWESIRKHNSHRSISRIWCHSLIGNTFGSNPPPEQPFGPASTPALGDTSILAVGQPGFLALNNPMFKSPSLTALYTAIDKAQRAINFSQQNMGAGPGKLGVSLPREFRALRTSGRVEVIAVGRFFGPAAPTGEIWYDLVLINKLAHALVRGTKVNVLITNSGAGAYTSGESPAHLYRALGYALMQTHSLSRKKAHSILQTQVSVKTLMSQGHIPWTTGNRQAKANHSKFWSVDDELFYVGSHNVYPTVITGGITGHLDEWGVVVAGQRETALVHEGYFAPKFASGYPVAPQEQWLDGIGER